MTDDNKSTEDTYKELEETLAKKEDEVTPAETIPAEKPAEEKPVVEKPAEETVKPAEEAVPTKEVTPESPKADEKPSQKFKNVEEFLEAVQDEPSRNLLKTFADLIRGENKAILEPVERANAEAKFEKEFSQYEKIDGLTGYKNDLKKTFLRDPNQDLKKLVGEVVVDLQTSKIKPIETTPSNPKRDGKVDTDSLSKDQLYDVLESMKGS